MITTLTLWTDDELAGGTQVARLDWVALRYGQAVDHTRGLEATIVADAATRKAVVPGRVVQVNSDRGTWTGVVIDVDATLDRATLRLRAVPVLHDLARVPVRDGTGATTFTVTAQTAAEVASTVVRDSLDAEGYDWVTLGTFDDVAIRDWSFGNTSVLEWVTTEARRQNAEVLWDRDGATLGLFVLGEDGLGAARVSLGAHDTGVTRTAWAGVNVQVLERGESIESPFGTVVQMAGAGGGTVAQAWWPVVAVDGTRVRLGERGGVWPVLQSGQYVGDGTTTTPTVYAEFLRLSQSPIDVLRVAITGSVEPDTLVFGSSPTVAAGDQVRFVGSSSGAELPTVSLEPAIRRVRRARRIVSSGTDGEINLHRNGRLRDWTGAHAAVDWTFPEHAITTPPTGSGATVQVDGVQTLVGAVAGASYSGAGGGGGYDPSLLTGTWTPPVGAVGDVLAAGWTGTVTLTVVDYATGAQSSSTQTVELLDPSVVGWSAYPVMASGVAVPVVLRLTGTAIPFSSGLYGLSGTWTLVRAAVAAPAPQTLALKGLTAGDVVIPGDTVAAGWWTFTVTETATADGSGKVTLTGTVSATGNQSLGDGDNVTLTRIRAGETVGGPWIMEPRWHDPDSGTWTSTTGTTSGTQVTPPNVTNATWTQEITGLPAGTVLQPGDGVTCTAWSGLTAYDTAIVRRRVVADGSGTALVSLWHPDTSATTMAAPTLGATVTVRRPDPAALRAQVGSLSAASCYRSAAATPTIPTTTIRLWPTPTRQTFRITARGWYWHPILTTGDVTSGTTICTLQLKSGGTNVGTAATVAPGSNINARTLYEWVASQTYTTSSPVTLTLEPQSVNDARRGAVFLSGVAVSTASTAPTAIDEYGGAQALYGEALGELDRHGSPAVSLRLRVLEDDGAPIAVGDEVLVDVAEWGTRDRVRVVAATYEAWRTTDGTAAEAAPELELVTQQGRVSTALASAGVFA